MARERVDIRIVVDEKERLEEKEHLVFNGG